MAMKSFTTIAAVALTVLTACSQQQRASGEAENLSVILKDFLTLIPPNQFEAIVSKHYNNDAQFAYVTKYVQTPEFEEVVERLEDSACWKSILQYLADAGVDVDSFGGSISAWVEKLLMPAEGEVEVEGGAEGEVGVEAEVEAVPEAEAAAESEVAAAPGDIIESRSLQYFLSDIVHAIPRQGFRQKVEEKMQQSEQFAKLYAAVSHKNFRRLVVKSMSAPEMAGPLRTLRRNGIDVVPQVMLLSKVISWGPRV